MNVPEWSYGAEVELHGWFARGSRDVPNLVKEQELPTFSLFEPLLLNIEPGSNHSFTFDLPQQATADQLGGGGKRCLRAGGVVGFSCYTTIYCFFGMGGKYHVATWVPNSCCVLPICELGHVFESLRRYCYFRKRHQT